MDSTISAIDEQYPCRTTQLKQLEVLVGDDECPSPPSFVVHGLEATGKTLILRTFLERTAASFSWVPCHECITVRHLAERIAASTTTALGSMEEASSRCENVSALAVYLRKLLHESKRKHFLVLDRIDCQKEATPTLHASLAQMGETISRLTVIFVVAVPRLRFLPVEVPHIYFSPYTKEESIEILSKYARRIEKLPTAAGSSYDDEEHGEHDAQEDLWVWQKFCGTVWDSMAKGAARNIVQFRAVVDKLWLPFVQPIIRGEFGTRNYSSLYLFHKDMFRREIALIDSVIPWAPVAVTAVPKTHDLPYYSKFLLCAAYLASYNPARSDMQFFVKASELKKRRRGGGAKRSGQKTRKISRRLLGPQTFVLERLLAIFHAITPHAVPSSIDTQSQIATLTSLHLLVKVSASDPLEGITKWKVNAGWDYIRGIARSVKFDLEDHLAE